MQESADTPWMQESADTPWMHLLMPLAVSAGMRCVPLAPASGGTPGTGVAACNEIACGMHL